MSQLKKPEAKLFAVLKIQEAPQEPISYQARLDSEVEQLFRPGGQREADLAKCPEGTVEVVFGLKATEAARLMKTHVTTVRRQADRAFCRRMGVPTQYERDRGFNQAQQDTRSRSHYQA